jgi:hypothetical protein
MKDEDDEFRKHILGLTQLFVFTLALMLLAMVYYTNGESNGSRTEIENHNGSGDSVRASEDLSR